MYIVYENGSGYFIGYKDKLSNTYSDNKFMSKKYINIGSAISRLGLNTKYINSLDNFLEKNLDTKKTKRFNNLESLLNSDITKMFFIKGKIEKIDENGHVQDASKEVIDYIENKINIRLKKLNHKINQMKKQKFDYIESTKDLDVYSKEYLNDFLNDFN